MSVKRQSDEDVKEGQSADARSAFSWLRRAVSLRVRRGYEIAVVAVTPSQMRWPFLRGLKRQHSTPGSLRSHRRASQLARVSAAKRVDFAHLRTCHTPNFFITSPGSAPGIESAVSLRRRGPYSSRFSPQAELNLKQKTAGELARACRSPLHPISDDTPLRLLLFSPSTPASSHDTGLPGLPSHRPPLLYERGRSHQRSRSCSSATERSYARHSVKLGMVLQIRANLSTAPRASLHQSRPAAPATRPRCPPPSTAP